MKKFIYLCGMMLLYLNMMAQIDLNDGNWDTVFFDDFTQSGRFWQGWVSQPDQKWRACPGFTLINGFAWYHVYQYANSLFCPAEGKMKIVGEYCDTICNNNYPLPGFMHGVYPSCDSLFYFSGEIDSYMDSTYNFAKFQYGFFEIRCKLPKHEGAHGGFWLCGSNSNSSDTYYEEIDIVEYSWSAGDPRATWLPIINPNATEAGDSRFYSTAIVQNLQGYFNKSDVYAMHYPHISKDQEDVSGWHTYACEWMPDLVYWYLDGDLVNSFFDKTHIPKHHLTLKTNYGIDSYAVIKIKDELGHIIGYEPDWQDTDTLTIDYIKVYQLEWDCNTDEVIACQNDLANFDYKVKKSVAVTSSLEEIEIGNTDKITFRVADSFEVTGPFQAESGCEFTVIRQDCPE